MWHKLDILSWIYNVTQVILKLKFIELDELSYLKYREQIIELYIQAYTTGEYAQYLERNTVEKTIDELINVGSGILALSVDSVVALLLASPLSEHSDFAFNNVKAFSVDKTIYINEVVVDKDFRGRGIAERIIGNFLNNISQQYHNAVIRVWDKNTPALSLYVKLNFEPIANITQIKLKSQSEEFKMEKIYLYKKLKN